MHNRLSPRALLGTNVKKMVLISISLLSLQLSGCANIGSDASAKEASLPPEVSSRLQAVLDKAAAAEAAKYPGVILRLETSAGTWSGTSGVANVETGSVVDLNAKFRAGSILKPFMATVVLQLVEEGKLSLDDRLTDLLQPKTTKLFENSDRITVRMLLNHTSGMGDWTGSNGEEEKRLYETIFSRQQQLRVWPVEELFEMAAQEVANFKPGKGWKYNNTEYNLLGVIVEKVTGETWRDNIRQRIFAKLQLKNTLLPESGNLKMPKPFVNGYSDFSGNFTDTTEVDPSLAGAAGGHALVTNTEDLSVFMNALLSGVFFDKSETLSNMMTLVETGDPGSYYGLGLMRIDLPNGSYAVGHTGMTAGYKSIVMYLPKEDITLASVITSHQGAGITDYLLPSLQIVAEHLQSQ